MKKLFFILFILFNFTNTYAQTTTNKPIISNPAISINALLTATAGSNGSNPNSESPNGFGIQEIETRFSANIDAYFRGDITLAVEKEDGEFIVEPEEVIVETTSLDSISIKVGKFYALLGRHNNLHTHAFPFLDQPLTNESILGEEGLNETGIALSYLAPTPWYLELTAQGFSAKNEFLFNNSTNDNVSGVLFIKNLWELSDASTLEFDLGYGNGRNEFKGNTHLYNLSMTYKWRPLERSTSKSITWTTEFLQSYREDAPEDIRVGGISSWLQWQFNNRWWVQARGEYLGLPKPDAGITRKYSALIGFVPTEFSSLRLQYDNIDIESEPDQEHKVTLQLSVSLGSHPAHSY